MNQFLYDWLLAIWQILAESGPYLLVGFFIAGLIKVLIPEEKVFRHLGKNDFRSVFIASCVGAPIPLCSCSVIPTALSLRRSGASKGATSSFLIATPETGVDSIGVTWALMDPIMTITRPLAAILTAIGCGSLVNSMVRRNWDDEVEEDAPEQHSCCSHEESELAAAGPEQDEHADHEHLAGEAVVRGGGPGAVIKNALRYAFGPLMADLTPWFILGFALSGLITVLVPDDFLRGAVAIGAGWATMLLMLVVGVPLYICATASTPVAAALMAKGLDPGAALVLLLAGPATNISTILFVRGFLGRKVLMAYLVSITVFCLGLGFLVNQLYGWLEIDPATSVVAGSEMGTGLISLLTGAALLLLLVVHAVRMNLAAALGRRLSALCRPFGFDPTSRLSRSVALVVLVLLYLSSGISSIRPGEVGFKQRFGRVLETHDQPGLVLHLPFPIERVEIVRDREIRGIEFGSDSRPLEPDEELLTLEQRGRDLDSESEVVTGDENLLRISYAVHYRVADGYRYRFGLEDPEALIRGLTESSLRHVVARRSLDQVLVASRSELEREARGLLHRELTALDSGLDAVSIKFLDVHSPPQTHYSFRDVASALEDKERSMRRAEGYEKERLSQARADAYRILQEADSYRQKTLDRASAEVAAFLSLLAEPAAERDVTRFRLRREAAERALAEARLILMLSDSTDVYLSGSGGPLPPAEQLEDD